MSLKPSTLCRHPGCGTAITSGRYCVRHAASQHTHTKHATYDTTTRQANPALAEAARIRNSSTWQKVRRMHRAREPLCCDPFGAHPDDPQPNQNSHHIEALVARPDLAFDLGNLASLCTACHARVERMERKGEASAHLFR